MATMRHRVLRLANGYADPESWRQQRMDDKDLKLFISTVIGLAVTCFLIAEIVLFLWDKGKK